MATRPSFPTDHEPTIAVRPAYGRYDDLATIVGTQRPGAGACWCMSYRDSRVANADRPGYLRDECTTAPGPGVLVYVDDVVAGWCSIAPRRSYRRLLNSRTIPILDDADVWPAVCFVVRAGYRKRGLAHHLLAGAVEHARGHGRAVGPRARPAAGGDLALEHHRVLVDLEPALVEQARQVLAPGHVEHAFDARPVGAGANQLGARALA